MIIAFILLMHHSSLAIWVDTEESFLQDYSALKNNAIRMCIEDKGNIKKLIEKTRVLLNSKFLKQRSTHFSIIYLKILQDDLVTISRMDDAQLKKLRKSFSDFEAKVFYEMKENNLKEDQKKLKELQQETLIPFKLFSIPHLYTEAYIWGGLLAHNAKSDLSDGILQTQKSFESSKWGKENPELHLFLNMLALNCENLNDFKKQAEIAKKEIEILTANFGDQEVGLLNPQGLLLEAQVNLGEIDAAKKTLDSINKSYFDVAEWYSAKVMAKIHRSSFLLYLNKKDYKSAKKSQRYLINSLKLYLNTDNFQLLKEVVRYRDLLARLNDFEEIGKVDKEFDLYPFIR